MIYELRLFDLDVLAIDVNIAVSSSAPLIISKVKDLILTSHPILFPAKKVFRRLLLQQS